MIEEKHICPGHEGKCEFCKEEYGKPRYVGSLMEMKKIHEVDPVTHRMYTTMEPVVDCCCHACGSNFAAKKSEYARTSIS